MPGIGSLDYVHLPLQGQLIWVTLQLVPNIYEGKGCYLFAFCLLKILCLSLPGLIYQNTTDSRSQITKKLFPLSSIGWKPQITLLVVLAFSEVPLLGFQMVYHFLCPQMVFPLCTGISSIYFSYKDTSSMTQDPLCSCLTLINSLKLMFSNTVTLGIRDSTNKHGEEHS